MAGKLNINKDTAYGNARPKEKNYTINDGSGLTMLVKTDGVKCWLFIYRIDGKQKRLGFGVYPAVSLDAARRKAEEARRVIAEGGDPSDTRKSARANSKRRTGFMR